MSILPISLNGTDMPPRLTISSFFNSLMQLFNKLLFKVALSHSELSRFFQKSPNHRKHWNLGNLNWMLPVNSTWSVTLHLFQPFTHAMEFLWKTHTFIWWLHLISFYPNTTICWHNSRSWFFPPILCYLRMRISYISSTKWCAKHQVGQDSIPLRHHHSLLC